jgi:long-chain acyl-CoA synthetase
MSQADKEKSVVAQLTGAGGAFEITTVPVHGVPLRVFATAPSSLRDLWLMGAARGDLPYLIYRDEVTTYAGAHEMVRSLVAWLVENGVKQGDRVAIGMRNYPEWAISYWAIQCIGAISVSLNAWWIADELKYALSDSGTTAVIVDGERLDRLNDDLLREVGVRHAVVVRGDARPGVATWSEVTKNVSAELPAIDIQPDDDATILYTSGTTGFPKGAVGSNRNHVTNVWNGLLRAAQNAAMADPNAPKPAVKRQPKALWTFPFFHIAGVTGVSIAPATGVALVTQYKWDAAEALQLIEKHKVTQISGVPAVVRSLLEHPDYSKFDLSSLATISQGGSPVPPDSIARIQSDFSGKVSPTNGYGLTETTSAVVGNAGKAYFGKKDSVGQPMIGTDIRIVDEEGSDLSTGSIGEVWIQSPMNVRGYWNKPEATEKSFGGGWFRTGDAGYVDADGFLYVVDRIKDMVIRGGENVYCAEVEAAVFEHESVADCAVFGVPHPTLMEEVALIVMPKVGHGQSSTDSLLAHLKSRLAAFKVPAHVFWTSNPLPRNATGKVLKKDLRDTYGKK